MVMVRFQKGGNTCVDSDDNEPMTKTLYGQYPRVKATTEEPFISSTYVKSNLMIHVNLSIQKN